MFGVHVSLLSVGLPRFQRISKIFKDVGGFKASRIDLFQINDRIGIQCSINFYDVLSLFDKERKAAVGIDNT